MLATCFSLRFLTQAFGFWLGLVGEVSLVGGGRLAAGATVALKFSNPFFQSLDAIPEHENEIRNSLGVSLSQSDQFVPSRSLHNDST